MVRFDPLALVEAAYALELPEAEWLAGMAESARTMTGQRNLGAYALVYDASDVARCTFGPLAPAGIDDRDLYRLLSEDIPRAYRDDPASVEAVFRRIPYGPSRRLPLTGTARAARETLVRLGARDILGLNGINVDGRGVHLGVVFPRPVSDSIDPDTLARLSLHLAASYRLRSRLGQASALDRAEAILRPDGHIEHATGPARLRDARESLVAAAVRIDRLKSARKREPDRALARWRALVDARWSLVDHFEGDGRRFVLAQRNDPAIGPFALLTTRERQVVALAALGYANKLIGYELGISVSTAGVLLSRAAKKLGAPSRAALIQAYEARTRRR
ncbi:MAG: response regulator transcription factor [Polyangiaceae bacterium]